MVGNNIKELRQQKHIKQETLADYLGVSSQAVSKGEMGMSDSDIAPLHRLPLCPDPDPRAAGPV